ncbi:hypothetical protein [Ornithinimicrobium kibberense]
MDNCYRIQSVRCRPTLSPYGYGMTQDSVRIRQAPRPPRPPPRPGL